MTKKLNYANFKIMTHTEKITYEAYSKFIVEKGRTPTLQELAGMPETPFNSRERARQLVDRLYKKNYLIMPSKNQKVYFPNWFEKGK